MSSSVQPTFGCDFLTTLGDDADNLWLKLQSECHNLWRVRHLEIQPRLNELSQLRDIAVLHMTAIFAQMRGDPVATSGFADYRGANWIRLAFGQAAITGLTQSRDVIDVDSQLKHGRYFLAGFFLSPCGMSGNGAPGRGTAGNGTSAIQCDSISISIAVKPNCELRTAV